MKGIIQVILLKRVSLLLVISLLGIGFGTSAQAEPFAYITDKNSNHVSVIDTQTNTIIATVSVGSYPEGVVVNPTGTRVYVANFLSSTVSVIDTATHLIIDTIPVRLRPYDVVMNSTGTRVYVTYDAENEDGRVTGNLSVVDTKTNTVIAEVWGEESETPSRAVNAEENILPVSDQSGNGTYVIDTENNNVVDAETGSAVDSVPVVYAPRGIAVDPMGSFIYVANGGDKGNSVFVISTATHSVIATIPIENASRNVAMHSTGMSVNLAN
jgi:YVTN family beta-propeller protein